MSKLIITVGLSGVGKSTVIEEAVNLSDYEFKWMNYGDKMFDIASERGLAENRDDMKDIQPETYKEIQEDAALQIKAKAEQKNVILDTHAAIKTPFGYVPGLPKWTVEMLEPNNIVFLWADPEEIVRRREEDINRDRELESAKQLDEYQSVAREMASSCAVLSGSYLAMIENERNKAEETAEDLAEILDH